MRRKYFEFKVRIVSSKSQKQSKSNSLRVSENSQNSEFNVRILTEKNLILKSAPGDEGEKSVTL